MAKKDAKKDKAAKAREAERKSLERWRVPVGGRRFSLEDRATDDKAGFSDRESSEAILAEEVARINAMQERLYASARQAVLVVLQAMDSGGKDGAVRHVFGPLDAQGVVVTSFKKPTVPELAHDYLWRVHQVVPPKGIIGVFNRSHYEDIAAVRMHELAPVEVWRRRYEHIRAFERMLVDEGTTVLKVFLNVSREEQRKRFQERIDDPEKRWKFRRDDLKVRERFDDWIEAWEAALSETSTEWAPWYVVPADRNWVKALAVAELVAGTLEALDPQLPEPESGLEGLQIT